MTQKENEQVFQNGRCWKKAAHGICQTRAITGQRELDKHIWDKLVSLCLRYDGEEEKEQMMKGFKYYIKHYTRELGLIPPRCL